MHRPPSISPSSSRRSGRGGMEYLTRHSQYYIDDGDLFILIEGVMFKVHSYLIRREARNFFDATPPSSPNTTASEVDHRGYSESTAMRPRDVTVEEFERLLWMFYDPTYRRENADILVWFSILKLAHRWDFPYITSVALEEIQRYESQLPLVTRIRMYQEHDAPEEYLVPLFVQLCAREMPPTNEEVVELGYEQMCGVWRAREALRFPGGVSPLPEHVSNETIHGIVSEVLDLPAFPVG
ncbi:hypothetical protein NMY22_g695 [Coprinellus aureogranulatus]|nr:hypothetical protein NMY22_g695 [Coprinellus aureogranulatus]